MLLFGAAGALLLYEDGTIQHTGMLVGNGRAEHLYRGRPARISGYINRGTATGALLPSA